MPRYATSKGIIFLKKTKNIELSTYKRERLGGYRSGTGEYLFYRSKNPITGTTFTVKIDSRNRIVVGCHNLDYYDVSTNSAYLSVKLMCTKNDKDSWK